MAHIINRPHAIYCNGELVGIITNPDPIGNPTYIEVLLGDDGDNIELRPMHPSTELAEAIRPLPETIVPKSHEKRSRIHTKILDGTSHQQ